MVGLVRISKNYKQSPLSKILQFQIKTTTQKTQHLRLSILEALGKNKLKMQKQKLQPLVVTLYQRSFKANQPKIRMLHLTLKPNSKCHCSKFLVLNRVMIEFTQWRHKQRVLVPHICRGSVVQSFKRTSSLILLASLSHQYFRSQNRTKRRF